MLWNVVEEKQLENWCEMYRKDFTDRTERLVCDVKDKCKPAKANEIVWGENNAKQKEAEAPEAERIKVQVGGGVLDQDCH